MQGIRRKLAVTLPLVAIVALVGIAATSPFPPDAVDSAKAWVNDNRSHLPKTLEAISELPIQHRKAVLAALTATEREAVWRKHLESFVKPTAELTMIQRRTLATLGDTLSPSEVAFVKAVLDTLHSGFSGDSVAFKKFGKEICAVAKKALRQTPGMRILTQVGPVTAPPVAFNQAGIITGLTGAIRTGAIKLGLRRPIENCSCNVDSYCSCPLGEWCAYSDCRQQQGWCGCFGCCECNGRACLAIESLAEPKK